MTKRGLLSVPARFFAMLIVTAMAGGAIADDPVPLKNSENAGGIPAAPDAAGGMQLPDGFSVNVFAAEPHVRNPINFTFDARGRLWVAENYSYPHRRETASDRVLIFEDTDGDGRFDRRKIFWEGGHFLTGVEVGFGGVWVLDAPHLLFIPDRNRDDEPDGEPQVRLTGWSTGARHNSVNGLRWGPDGWLYGRHGGIEPSRVGKPVTPEDERREVKRMIWRYHPTRRRFDRVTRGTVNPWGLDWNARGQMFFTSSVVPHLWHGVPGAHFPKSNAFNFIYERMGPSLDHLHFAGHWTASRNHDDQRIDNLGGGHSHAGLMIYQGGKWPAEYRGDLFICNIHGRRLNRDELKRRGSGYVASHRPDFFHANNDWFRGIGIKSGPGGDAYLIDWADYGGCHDRGHVHRTSGRIYKITYGDHADLGDLNLRQRSSKELAELQRHRNVWYVRRARRLLQERAAAGADLDEARRRLRRMFATDEREVHKLRALWALHVTGGLDESWLIEQLDHDSEHVRAWTVRLLTDDGEPPQRAVSRFAGMAGRENSPLVRLHLASTLQLLPMKQRWDIARGLVQHEEDAGDPNLPLMLWYAIEPLVPRDAERALKLSRTSNIPKVTHFIIRRASEKHKTIDALIRAIDRADSTDRRRMMLRQISIAFKDRAGVNMPDGWPGLYDRLKRSEDPKIRRHARYLAVKFGDDRVFPAMRELAVDEDSPLSSRRQAVRLLVDGQDPKAAPVLQQALDEPALREKALAGLARYSHPDTPGKILKRYESFDAAARRQALNTLAARPAYAGELLDAVESGRVPKKDVSAYHVRQMLDLNDEALAQRVKRLWGTIRNTPEEKKKRIENLRDWMKPQRLADADRSHGRVLFNRRCASCHTLFGKGASIGPDLTGANRDSVQYLLKNVVDPDAIVSDEYQLAVVRTTDGRVVSGMIESNRGDTLVVRTPAAKKVTLDRSKVKKISRTSRSMMPEGLLKGLDRPHILDLIAYLQSDEQVPLPEQTSGETAESD